MHAKLRMSLNILLNKWSLYAKENKILEALSLAGVHVRDLEALSDFMESIYASPLRGLGEDKMC